MIPLPLRATLPRAYLLPRTRALAPDFRVRAPYVKKDDIMSLEEQVLGALRNHHDPDSRAALQAAFAAVDAKLDGDVGGVGSGDGVTTEEEGTSAIQRTVLTLADTPVVLVDEAGVVAYGSLLVYTFPVGVILFLGAVADLAFTQSSTGVNADWDGDFGLGTAACANDGTLTGTEVDFIPTTATPTAVAGATTGDGDTTTALSGVIFDGTGGAKECYLNVLVDDADHDVTSTPCNIIANGTITLTWILLGDN